MVSHLPEPLPPCTVRLLPGQHVLKRTLCRTLCVASTSLGVGGAHASVCQAALGRFHCGSRRVCAEQPTADDRAVLHDLLGGIDPFTPLLERLLSLLVGAAPQPVTRLLGPIGADGPANGGGRSPCCS